MTSRLLAIVICTGLSAPLYAQQAGARQPAAPTLDQILQRLDANLALYDRRVPSFLCDEHIASRVESERRIETVTDSTFRLRRVANTDHTTTLEESRDLKTVNGKPPASPNEGELDGPSMLYGVFEGGLAVISSTQSVCIDYTLQRINGKHPADTYLIRFRTVLTPQNRAACLLEEDSKGSAIIDAASMQIRHLDITTPHHTIVQGNAYEPAIIGKRVLAVDYAPVLLNGETLWMPADIAMDAIGGSNTFHVTTWSFKASYRNYHKLEVTTRIHGESDRPEP